MSFRGNTVTVRIKRSEIRLSACKARTHQADNLAKLWQDILSLLELIAQILCAVVGEKSKRDSRQYANLRVAVASAMIFARGNPALRSTVFYQKIPNFR